MGWGASRILSEMSIFFLFFTHKLLKMYYSTKLKTTHVRFFGSYSMCVQLFTTFELAVLKLYFGKPESSNNLNDDYCNILMCTYYALLAGVG